MTSVGCDATVIGASAVPGASTVNRFTAVSYCPTTYTTPVDDTAMACSPPVTVTLLLAVPAGCVGCVFPVVPPGPAGPPPSPEPPQARDIRTTESIAARGARRARAGVKMCIRDLHQGVKNVRDPRRAAGRGEYDDALRDAMCCRDASHS